MTELRVLLADDEPLARRGLRRLLSAEPGVTVIAECRHGREAVEQVRALTPDVAFLDVQMPELDGLGVVRELGERVPPAVVFVTAYDEYALRAFDVHAVDYLLKPVDPARFATALARVRGRLATHAPSADPAVLRLLAELAGRTDERPLERIPVRLGRRVQLVAVADIVWLEAADNYVRIHTNGPKHLIRDTLKALEQRLDARHFVRVHRSAMVNLAAVRELRPLPSGDHAVLLATGEKVTLSRSFRDAFERRLGGRL